MAIVEETELVVIGPEVFASDFFKEQSFRIGTEHVVDEVPNWPDSAGLLSKSFYSIWASIALAVGLYDGLHVPAWNSHFPTVVERVLWCISSVLVAAPGSLALILIAVDRLPSLGRESYITGWWEVINQNNISARRTIFLTAEVAMTGLILHVLVVPLVIGILAYMSTRAGFALYTISFNQRARERYYIM